MYKLIKCLAAVVIVAVGDLATSVRQLEACTNGQQRSILSMALHCEPRETVVQLDLPNDTYVHVAPSHVTVLRCGASCHNRFGNRISLIVLRQEDILAFCHFIGICAMSDYMQWHTCKGPKGLTLMTSAKFSIFFCVGVKINAGIFCSLGTTVASPSLNAFEKSP